MTDAVPATRLGLVGPTAVGKSAIAIEVARRLGDVEILTIDSMQVYRGMDIGTAKPTVDERMGVAHHLLDLVDVDEPFTLRDFQIAATEAVAAIEARGNRPLLVGGTGLYLRAVMDDLDIPGRYPEVREALEADPDTAQLHARLADLDPVAAARMEPSNRRRVIRALEVTIGSGRPFSTFGPGLETHPPTDWDVVALAVDRDLLADRIAARLASQMDAGFFEEVAALARRPGGVGRTAAQALGYRQLLDHLGHARDEYDVARPPDLDEALDETLRATRRLARRQRSWFRRDPRLTPMDATDLAAVIAALTIRWENRSARRATAMRESES